jgi:hypothetical protein
MPPARLYAPRMANDTQPIGEEPEALYALREALVARAGEILQAAKDRSHADLVATYLIKDVLEYAAEGRRMLANLTLEVGRLSAQVQALEEGSDRGGD